MASTQIAAPPAQSRPATSGRFGYLVAIAINGAGLWIAHHLLEWQWPGFLTDDFIEVLSLLSASLLAGMAVNVGFLLHDHRRFRAAGDMVTGAFGLALSLRLWHVFPFDFTGYDTDWSWVLRVGLAVGIGGTVIAMIVNAGKLARAPGRQVD